MEVPTQSTSRTPRRAISALMSERNCGKPYSKGEPSHSLSPRPATSGQMTRASAERERASSSKSRALPLYPWTQTTARAESRRPHSQ